MKEFVHSKEKSQGFTLVETALALLVASIGLTAVMALFPMSMDQNKKTMDETYAAFISDAAFASYRAVAESRDLSWDQIKTYEAIAPASITGAKDIFWKNSKNLRLKADGAVHTNVFIATSTDEKWVGSGAWPMAASWQQYDHAMRYRMTWTDIDDRLRGLTLEVWPGEFGITTNKPIIFYTEIFNHGI